MYQGTNWQDGTRKNLLYINLRFTMHCTVDTCDV